YIPTGLRTTKLYDGAGCRAASCWKRDIGWDRSSGHRSKGERDEAQCPQPVERQNRRGHQGSDNGIDIGGGVIVTSSITNEAVDDVALTVGDDAVAVVKASDVMVAK